MHFLQRQIRLCSSRIAQPLENAVDFDDNIKVIDIPKAVFETQSKPIQHEEGNGHLFSANDLYVRLAAPHQLQPKPDADALTFGKSFTDHMLKVFWHKSLGGWQKPEITPMENLVIHPAAKVLHYAVEVSQAKTNFSHPKIYLSKQHF